jgi:hypothetical protein
MAHVHKNKQNVPSRDFTHKLRALSFEMLFSEHSSCVILDNIVYDGHGHDHGHGHGMLCSDSLGSQLRRGPEDP